MGKSLEGEEERGREQPETRWGWGRLRHAGLWRSTLAQGLPVGSGLARWASLARHGPSTPGLGPGPLGLSFRGPRYPSGVTSFVSLPTADSCV